MLMSKSIYRSDMAIL